MISFFLWLLLLFQQNISSTTSADTTVTSANESYSECIPCHIVRIDVSMDGVRQIQLQTNPIKCITKHPFRSYRTSYDIDLPESFLHSHQNIIDGGDALICVNDAYIDDSINRIVITPTSDHSFTVSSYKATKQKQQGKHRLLQPNRQEIRLLVVRIIDVNGIEPIVSMESIEGAMFGTGPNPDNLSETASVVQQLAAITHDKVLLVPSDSITTTQFNGVIEVPIALPVNGSGFFRELLSEILNATELVVGPMDDAADAYVFCLPDGSSLVGQTGWSGLSVSLEPVR